MPTRSHFLRIVLLVPTALLVMSVLACGGGGGRSKEQVKADLTAYFDKYGAIHQDVNGRIVGLKAKYPNGYLDLTDKSKTDIQQTKDSYRDYTALFDEFDNRVRALNPPAEISDVVQQILEADQAVSVINHDRLSKLQAATTVPDLDTIFAADPAFTSAANRTVQTCDSLIERAKQYDSEPDLPCK